MILLLLFLLLLFLLLLLVLLLLLFCFLLLVLLSLVACIIMITIIVIIVIIVGPAVRGYFSSFFTTAAEGARTMNQRESSHLSGNSTREHHHTCRDHAERPQPQKYRKDPHGSESQVEKIWSSFFGKIRNLEYSGSLNRLWSRPFIFPGSYFVDW